jgi:hypothetical protein
MSKYWKEEIINVGTVPSPRGADKAAHVMSLLTAAWQAHLEAKETLRGDDFRQYVDCLLREAIARSVTQVSKTEDEEDWGAWDEAHWAYAEEDEGNE